MQTTNMLTERSLDEEKRMRIVAFFDGQNVLRTSNEVFGLGRGVQWNYDPRKLVEATRDQMEARLGAVGAPCPHVVVQQIRFYTGVPTFERDLYGRSYWERLFTRFRNDHIVVVSRNLRYYTQGPPREKGIDLRIGLDIVRIATSGMCDGILLFSQDSDLYEAVEEAKALLARSGPQRPMYYFCAFPRSADPMTNHGVKGMHWIPLYGEDFEKTLYELPPKVDIEALIGSLERRYRKKALRDFDLHKQGKFVSGCFRGCHRVNDDDAVLIIEGEKSYLFIMNVPGECEDMLGKFTDLNVNVAWRGGHPGRLDVEVRLLNP
jgi:hypothetical protein